MGKNPAFQFYTKDWLGDPQLRAASGLTRGFWMDFICYMWDEPERGKLTRTPQELARMVGAENGQIDEFLEEAKRLGFCDISVTDNGNVTLCNRRMFRNDKEKEYNRLRQQRYRESQACHEEITPPSSSSSSSSNKKKEIKKEKFGEFGNVFLTVAEVDKLLDRFGRQGTGERIENLSVYLESKGKRYKSHYATILSWDRMNSGKGSPAAATDPRTVCKRCKNPGKNLMDEVCPKCRGE